jgi:orotate phosphoribosyltransferase
MRSRENLRRILKGQLLKKDVTLTSGKKSHFYIDCRPLVLDPFARVIITSQIAQVLTKVFTIIPCKEFDAIGGPTFSGAIMAVAFSNLLAPYSLVIPFAYHSTKHQLIVPEGKIQDVVLVDDVLSTGGTLVAMNQLCVERGYNVKAAVVIVDREEPESMGMRELFPILSIFTAREIQDEV